MNPNVEFLARTLVDNGILNSTAVNQFIHGAGGANATLDSVNAALGRALAPWDDSTFSTILAPHIAACIDAAMLRRDLPYPGFRLGSSLLLQPIEFMGQKIRFYGVEYDARVPSSGPPTHTVAKIAITPDEQARLRNEVRMLRDLEASECRGVPSVREFVEGESVSWLSLQRVPGIEVASIVAREGALPIKSILSVGLRLLATLAEANAAGVFHRNLYPSHIICTGEVHGSCDVSLVGWSLGRGAAAAETEDEFRRSSSTPPQLRYPEALAFWSPEQRRPLPEIPIESACDVYGFGSTLFYMASGRPPGESPDQALSALQAPAEFKQLLGRLLAADPAQRPSLIEAAEGLVAIDQALTDTQAASDVAPQGGGDSARRSNPASQPAAAALASGTRVVGTQLGGPPPLNRVDPKPASPLPKTKAQATPPPRPARSTGSHSSQQPHRTATRSSQVVSKQNRSSRTPSAASEDTAVVAVNDDTKIDLFQEKPKARRGSGLRAIDSNRVEPLVVVDDPLDLAVVGDASISKLAGDLLSVHWPSTDEEADQFLRGVHSCLELLTDESVIQQGQRQAAFGKDKAAVGNFAEAVPLLLSAWQCTPTNHELYLELLRSRAMLASKGRSVFKKAFGAASKLNPTRVVPVYHSIASGKIIEAIKAADKLLASTPDDGRALWAIAIGADLLEAWLLCEVALDKLWELDGCGGADSVAVAAARTKLVMVCGDVEEIQPKIRDLDDTCRSAGVPRDIFEKFTRTIAADIHTKKYRRKRR